jgi:hypothetical protein
MGIECTVREAIIRSDHLACAGEEEGRWGGASCALTSTGISGEECRSGR